MIILNKVMKISKGLKDEEIDKRFGNYLNKLAYGICSVDLLLDLCRENKLWTSIIRVVALLVDKNGQVIKESNDGTAHQQVQRRMEQAYKCQGIVNSAYSQYVREKYNSSETSNRRIAKLVTSLQKKHGIFSVLD